MEKNQEILSLMGEAAGREEICGGERVKGVAVAPEKYLETGMLPEKTNLLGLSDNAWLTK